MCNGVPTNAHIQKSRDLQVSVCVQPQVEGYTSQNVGSWYCIANSAVGHDQGKGGGTGQDAQNNLNKRVYQEAMAKLKQVEAPRKKKDRPC